MGAHDRIPSDPAISRHESPNGVCRRSLPKHDRPARSMRIGIRQIFILTRGGTLGPPPLFEARLAAPTHPAFAGRLTHRKKPADHSDPGRHALPQHDEQHYREKRIRPWQPRAQQPPLALGSRRHHAPPDCAAFHHRSTSHRPAAAPDRAPHQIPAPCAGSASPHEEKEWRRAILAHTAD